MSERIFQIGGWLLVASGAIGLFFWIASILDGWAYPTIIPAITALLVLEGMELLKGIFITVGSVLFSVSLILCGFLFVKIPKLTASETAETTNLEQKMNKLQLIVWRLLQKVKELKAK